MKTDNRSLTLLSLATDGSTQPSPLTRAHSMVSPAFKGSDILKPSRGEYYAHIAMLSGALALPGAGSSASALTLAKSPTIPVHESVTALQHSQMLEQRLDAMDRAIEAADAAAQAALEDDDDNWQYVNDE